MSRTSHSCANSRSLYNYWVLRVLVDFYLISQRLRSLHSLRNGLRDGGLPCLRRGGFALPVRASLSAVVGLLFLRFRKIRLHQAMPY